MNRRGFFRSLVASAVVAAASSTRIGQTALRIADEYDPVLAELNGRTYALALARSMQETRETLAANILNRAFEPYDETRYLSGAWQGATEWNT